MKATAILTGKVFVYTVAIASGFLIALQVAMITGTGLGLLIAFWLGH